MIKKPMKKLLMSLVISLGLGATAIHAEDMDGMEPKHKVVIQVSTADELTHKTALNNAVNLQKALGLDDVAIEIVAYGPGLSLFTGKSPESGRVSSLAAQNITMTACGNTVENLTKKAGGVEPKLEEGVRVVAGGIIRIMELQEAGYSYIRP
jgi:intracellular sulfur oxidation DsrE/DsrF family protein